MTEEEQNKIAAIERAIANKYGEETIQNPRSNWTDEKESEYLKELSEKAKREKNNEELEKINKNGYQVTKKVMERKSNRYCSRCKTYSFNGKDDVYMTRFNCCFKCYVLFIEGR